jgi:transposase-like protein
LRTSERSVPQLAKELGVSEGSLRNWVGQRDVDEGRTEGLNSDERDELRRLRRENKVLAERREILKKCPWPRAAASAGENPGRWVSPGSKTHLGRSPPDDANRRRAGRM